MVNCKKCGVKLIQGDNWFNCDADAKYPVKWCKSCRTLKIDKRRREREATFEGKLRAKISSTLNDMARKH